MKYNNLVEFYGASKSKSEKNPQVTLHRYPPNPKLGRWVKSQRQCKKAFDEGITSSINSYQIDALNSLDFVWNNCEIEEQTESLTPDVIESSASLRNSSIDFQEVEYTLENATTTSDDSCYDDAIPENEASLSYVPNDEKSSAMVSAVWRCDNCFKAFFETQSQAWEHAVECNKKKRRREPTQRILSNQDVVN